jgi:hypothetical protein
MLGNFNHGLGIPDVGCIVCADRLAYIVLHYRNNLLLQLESLCLPFPPRYNDTEINEAGSYKA